MTLQEDITNKVKTIIKDDFTYTDVNYIPKIDDSKLTFGNTGLRFNGAVLFIDMRGSTKLLNSHNKITVAKLHMAYFHTIVKIANSHNGNVRSFNGDSALIFFEGNSKDTISTAVKCAMNINYMIRSSKSGINELLKKFSKINFGIGIDYGSVMCTKVGIGGEHNRDLFWIANSVNKSTRLGDQSKSPNNISISKIVYDNLLDWAKYGKKENLYKQQEQVNMWQSSTFEYNDETEKYYYTSWHWSI